MLLPASIRRRFRKWYWDPIDHPGRKVATRLAERYGVDSIEGLHQHSHKTDDGSDVYWCNRYDCFVVVEVDE